MKIMLINGSPHAKGCSYTALAEMEKIFAKNGIETEWVWVGSRPLAGCIGCGHCRQAGQCVFGEDMLNDAVQKFRECDAMLVASPVHYASASGAVTSFLDRFFYSSNRADLRLKPAACVVSCRRGGATAAVEQLNKYFTISEMPVVYSCYWNMIHGNTPEEIQQDLEGLRILRTLANNMVYLLKAQELAKQAGLQLPEPEPAAVTNFIR